MFGWLFGTKTANVEDETKKAFSAVKEDIKVVGKWIEHLNEKDKQLFKAVSSIKDELSTIREEISELHEEASLAAEEAQPKQVFKKLPVFGKQTAVEGVYNPVQTPVQTGNIYEILRGLSANERVLVFTLLNAEEGMKLSYEDIAMLLGKERATIRGQINSIKQKSEGLIKEIVEKNGKKRVFIPAEIKEKMAKYAKVRVGGKKI